MTNAPGNLKLKMTHSFYATRGLVIRHFQLHLSRNFG
jgi:hypothetical protein